MPLSDDVTPPNFCSLTRTELQQQLVHWGIKPAHAARLRKYLYIELVSHPDAMPEPLPKLAERLRTAATRGGLPTALDTASND